MADAHGHTPDPVIDELVKRPFAFDFFRAVRLLECQRPELPRIGFSISPAEDPVRFWQNPSMRFAPSPLDSVRAGGPDSVPRIAVNFFGLFGPNAPMPPHITEYVLERELHHHDPTITAFFNLFHHRLISLFYRAWAANQKSADLDRPDGQRFSTYIGSLFGIGMDALQERDAVPDPAKLFFAGRLSSQTRNAEGLEAILREYFHIPAEVQSFTGRWLTLPGDSVCQIGMSPESGSLGENTIMGSRFWDCQLGFRIKFGPMSLADYDRMLPQGDAFERLKYWVLNYCGEHFFWDAQLVLRAEEVPATRLGYRNGGSSPFSLNEVSDMASLALKLGNPVDAVSTFLKSRLSATTRQALEQYDGLEPVNNLLEKTLITELNAIVHGPSIYDPKRFRGVSLRPETLQLNKESPSGPDLVCLNRLLLEDAFPKEMTKKRCGLGWTTWLKTKNFSRDADQLILSPPPE